MSSRIQTTAKNILEVMEWIETNDHHFASMETPGFLILKGHHALLRVPITIWSECDVQPGELLDKRMYRWDHRAAAARRKLKTSEAQAKVPHTQDNDFSDELINLRK